MKSTASLENSSSAIAIGYLSHATMVWLPLYSPNREWLANQMEQRSRDPGLHAFLCLLVSNVWCRGFLGLLVPSVIRPWACTFVFFTPPLLTIGIYLILIQKHQRQYCQIAQASSEQTREIERRKNVTNWENNNWPSEEDAARQEAYTMESWPRRLHVTDFGLQSQLTLSRHVFVAGRPPRSNSPFNSVEGCSLIWDSNHLYKAPDCWPVCCLESWYVLREISSLVATGLWADPPTPLLQGDREVWGTSYYPPTTHCKVAHGELGFLSFIIIFNLLTPPFFPLCLHWHKSQLFDG